MDIEKVIGAVYGEKKQVFYTYLNLLQEGNKKFNLTSVLEEKEAFIKHFIDSAAGESLFPENCSVLEVGSGGGFPSIPLKILREDLHFTLVESTGKKCGFLNEVVDKLGLCGVQVVNARAEELARNALYREKYGAVCARAVARLNVLCEYCLPFVKTGGLFIAYKGDCADEVNEAARAVEVLGGKIVKVERYSLPENMGERSLVVIEKVKRTPEKYPRGRGMERKKPIV